MRSFGRGIAAAALALAVAGTSPVNAQTPVAIQGGTVHTLTGEPFVGTVVVQDGRVLAVGSSAQVPADAQVIDATGLHVYPGLFDAGSQLGLVEIGSVDVTADYSELGDYTPHLQSRTGVHPASEHIPVARSNGITHTLALPGGGGGWFGGGGSGFPGQASTLLLDGWTVEEMDVEPGTVMVLDWPTIRNIPARWAAYFGGSQSYREQKEEYDEAVARIGHWLQAARDYDHSIRAGADIRRDLRLEALARVANGNMPVLARVDSERDIRNVVEFANREGLRLVIGGGAEAYRVADLLASRDIPVILGPAQALPQDDDRPYDEAYTNAGKLHQAGVTVAFATYNSADSRTLPYEAAAAVPFGMPRDVALAAITRTPAEILGLGDRLGTIEPGKMANLIVTDGDPLEITTRVRHLIIDGREVSTMDRHEELYERYRSRPLPATR